MNFFNPSFSAYPNPAPQIPQIDPARFKQSVSKLNQEDLKRLVQQARANGIPDDIIEAGLNQILNMK